MLSSVPDGFNQDEASFGYNAYSILKTGKDEYGRVVPIVLESFGDNKLALFSYWLIPFIGILGLSEFSVRLGIVVAGILSLIITYVLVKELFRNKKLALLTTFILSITPWHFVFSRYASETMLALLFYLVSVLLFCLWFRSNNFYYFLFCIIMLLFSTLSYYSSWTPIIFTICVYSLILIRKEKIISLIIKKIIILSIPIVIILALLMSSGRRVRQINILEHSNAYPLLQEQIREDQLKFPINITRLFHNKLTFYPSFILNALSKNLSFDFLFLSGDKPENKFSIPYNGVLYLWLSPFLFIGFIYLFKKKSIEFNLVLYGLIFSVFIGSALSVYGSESQRSIIAAPIFCLVCSYGILTILKHMKKEWIFVLLFLIYGSLIFYQIANFNHQYFWHAQVHTPWFNNYGEKEMVQTLELLKSKYREVIIAGNPYIFSYFFNKEDPKMAQLESDEIRTNELGYRFRVKLGDYLLMPLDCPAAGKLKTLYICKGNKIPKNSHIIKIIRYRDGQPAYIFLEFMPQVSGETPPINLNYMTKYGIISDQESINWLREDQL